MMQHFYNTIPGWLAFQPLYYQAVEQYGDGARFVEVGSWLGRSAAYMAVEIENSGKKIEFNCVDPWIDGGPDLRDTRYFKELHVQQVYDIFLRNVHPVIHRIRALRMTSLEAAEQFEDGSVDFLMLDGDHSYEAVIADLHAWMPKMRRGGIISGDDYTWPGVEQAVDEVFGQNLLRTSINRGKRRNADYRLDSSYWWVHL